MRRSISRRRGAVISIPQVGGGVGGAARFRGDPGPGKVLTGATVFTGDMGVADGNAWLDENSGVNHLLKRIYYTGFWNRNTVINYRNAGKVPSIAMKMGANAANIAAIAGGSIDATVTAEAVWAAGQGYPIYTAFFHEPEDDFTTLTEAANYRAAYRRIVDIFRNNGATNVMWTGVAYMCSWTFEAGSGRDWWIWDPDWKGTTSGAGGVPNASDWFTGSQSSLDLMSFDQYTPTIGASAYHEFSANLNIALNMMTAQGRPIIPWLVLEMGTKVATGMPSDGWTGYFQRAFRYMRDHNGAGYVYYNTDRNNFLNGTDAAARFAGYQDALASESAYVVSTRPPDAGVGGAGTSAVTFVGAGIAGGNAVTVAPGMPTGTQIGDVAVAFWTHSTTATITSDPTASGWTLAASNNGSAGGLVAKVFTKILTGGDAGPSITMSGLTRHSAVLVVYRGVDTTTPLDVAPTVDTTHAIQETHNPPPITTTSNNCVIVTSIHERGTNLDTEWTVGTGYTERGDTGTLSVGSAGTITAVADNGPALVPAGTVTPTDWTGDFVGGTNGIVTYTLALRAQ